MSDNRGGGGNGFLLGLIMGGAIVFLLGTDKGRAILKSLTDEGISELSDILEEVEDGEEEYEEEPAPVRKAKAKVETVEEKFEEPVSNGVSHSAPAKRRFFRRTKS